MLGEKAQALSATPAVFESRLGRRLISNQVLDVFVIVVRPLLAWGSCQASCSGNFSPGENLPRDSQALLALNSPLAGWPSRRGPGERLEGGKSLWGHFCCWHHGGRAEVVGCHWLQHSREGRRGRGGLCVPLNQDPRCLCWSPLGSERGCPCPRRAVTMLVASVLEKRTNRAAGAEPAVGGRGKLRHGDALSLTKHLT